ncbi:hypothetical protein [Kribbella sp. NPDC049227]|uniref:hypothetical protein n=1 Tax=Kribbella sp. NPDC049227 TaxID=3364113 RepID=UPI00371795FC
MTADEMRKDLRAAVAARQELGPEYEAEIIDSFLERLDARDAARHQQDQGLEIAGLKPRETDPGGLALAIVSVSVAIPITAISADMLGLRGLIVSWAGLVAINFARTIGRRNSR